MTNADEGPLEVWLRQDDTAIVCTVVRDDESTYELDVDALSMRGAQREITGYLIDQGYEPTEEWQVEVAGASGPVETVRRFGSAHARDTAPPGYDVVDAFDVIETVEDLSP